MGLGASMADEGEGSKRVKTDLSMTAEISSWSVRYDDTLKRPTSRFTAKATLSVYRDWRLPHIVVGPRDRIPLASILADIEFSARTGETPSITQEANPEVDEAWLESLKPSDPIGRISAGDSDRDGPDRYPAGIWLQISLTKEHFEELRDRYLDGKPMPPRLELRLPTAELLRINGDETDKRGMLVFDMMPHAITKVEWSYEPNKAAKRTSIEKPAIKMLLDMVDFKYDGWKVEEHQFRTIASELVASAILGRNPSPHDRLEDRIQSAWSLAVDLFDQLAEAELKTRNEREGLKSKRKRGEGMPSVPWQKRHLANEFSEGLDAWSWSSITKFDIEGMVWKYRQLGLISPTFEWVIVDILVYAEARQFAEEIKRASPAFGGVWSFKYEMHAGNLERVNLKRLGVAAVWSLAKTALWIGVPAYYAWSEWSRGQTDTAMLIALGWFAVTMLWAPFKKAIGFAPTPENKDLLEKGELFKQMIWAYAEVKLDRPPGVVLARLDQASASGASWDGDVWSILKLAEERSRVSWQYHHEYPEMSAAKEQISSALFDASMAYEREGAVIRKPKFDGDRVTLEGDDD